MHDRVVDAALTAVALVSGAVTVLCGRVRSAVIPQGIHDVLRLEGFAARTALGKPLICELDGVAAPATVDGQALLLEPADPTNRQFNVLGVGIVFLRFELA